MVYLISLRHDRQQNLNTTDSHGDCLVPGAELPAPGSARNRTSPNRLTYKRSTEMQESPGSISTPKSASAPAAKHTPENKTKTVPLGKGGWVNCIGIETSR